MREFKPTGFGNYIWNVCKGLVVSYNPGADNLMSPDTCKGETALVSNGKYLILNGDWRQEYVNAHTKGGVDEMLDLFHKNEEHKSSWSN